MPATPYFNIDIDTICLPHIPEASLSDFIQAKLFEIGDSSTVFSLLSLPLLNVRSLAIGWELFYNLFPKDQPEQRFINYRRGEPWIYMIFRMLSRLEEIVVIPVDKTPGIFKYATLEGERGDAIWEEMMRDIALCRNEVNIKRFSRLASLRTAVADLQEFEGSDPDYNNNYIREGPANVGQPEA